MYTKANLASLRVKKDIAELSRQRFSAAHSSTSIDFPDGTRNLLKLKVGVSMSAGLYEDATFYFLLTIPPSYPFHAPSVTCTTRAWHPNINLHTGVVSLPILTKDWRPVLSINTVVFALQLMFLEPTEQMPVNEAAASALANPEVFREQVRRTLAGGWLFGVHFEPHTQGSGGGRGGAAKRKRGEGMDTDAVQSTLQAMRIQGDESAEELLWDKRPRRQSQSPHVVASDHRQPASSAHGQGELRGGMMQLDFASVETLPQTLEATALNRSAVPTCGTSSTCGLRCSEGIQAGVPPSQGGIVPDTPGAGVGWAGPLQAVSAPRIGRVLRYTALLFVTHCLRKAEFWVVHSNGSSWITCQWIEIAHAGRIVSQSKKLHSVIQA